MTHHRTIRVPAHTADREAHVLRTETRSLSEPLGENSDTDFTYPPLTYTSSDSDLMPPT